MIDDQIGDEDETPRFAKLSRDARLESLDRRLGKVEQDEADKVAAAKGDEAHRFGQKLVGQLVGAPAGGLLIGWGLDTLFGTRPLMMIVMMFVGFGVGIRNVYYWTQRRSAGGGQGTEKR